MCRLCRDLLDLSLQLLHVAANNTARFLTILEQHKGGHGIHAQFPRNTLQLIHVHREETHILMLLAQLADNRGNGLARTTPSRIEVDDDGTGGDEGFEDDLAVGSG